MKLLLEHFKAYHHLYQIKNVIVEETKTRVHTEKVATSARLVKEKTQILVVDRLTNIHYELTSLPLEAGLQADELEFLVTTQKSLLRSYFNLLTLEKEE